MSMSSSTSSTVIMLTLSNLSTKLVDSVVLAKVICYSCFVTRSKAPMELLRATAKAEAVVAREARVEENDVLGWRIVASRWSYAGIWVGLGLF
ncbi:hypothetical protein COLO4_38021 [Corchorus olitorius]|uniref:Uncharacterized protein n=1 Tax=Corchorus olitorius TaxID=93759 RepID=A0A1R3FXJ0_9ROSI|nr:hypothetical protein COLO4_38021 [Corchorus olitorius]